jgi:4-diphosphocytidyl-2-C-methyl-D-erythritol kinase
MTAPGLTSVLAPAKLTWFLEITRSRPDGFHDLCSEMVSLNLADTLTLEPAAVTEVVLVPTGDPRCDVVIEPDTNLVTRALRLAGRRARVELTKRVPVGGGLGGGSSDAGAVLRWAHWRDVAAAAVLGGDVPFCLVGGRALVEGIGERVTPLAFEERTVTLFIPNFGIDTADCYRAYDELTASGRRPTGRNHLNEPARLVEPRLAATQDWLAAETGAVVELCGSGSTLFVEGTPVPTGELAGPAGPVRAVVARTVPAS